MAYSSTPRKQGQRGCCPFPLHPKPPPNLPPLRSGQSCLTIPNTSSTITMPASLRSDCCSPSFRNPVRLPSGIDVHLHRNTHEVGWNSWRDNRFGDRLTWQLASAEAIEPFVGLLHCILP